MNKSLIFELIKLIGIPFLFVVIMTPLVKKFANFIGAMDVPNERKVHKKPMPRLGGLAIYSGFLLGYILFCEQSALMNSVLIASFIIIFTGLIDDIKPLKPLPKFIGQIIAALIIVFYGNLTVSYITAFGLYIDFGIFKYIISIFIILGCINCINLIDGLDGLACGISSIYFLTIGIVSIIMNKFGLSFDLTFILLGCCLGFLIYNFNPASIFMGDSGSQFLGLIIGVIAMLGFKNVTLTSLVIPLLLLAIPILDTLFAIIRRKLKHESISHADKCHIHHQLLRRNISHKNVVLIIYGIDILFALASLVYLFNDAKLGFIIYFILIIIIGWFLFKTDVVFEKKKKKKD